MGKATVFISYHPGSIDGYDYLAELDNKKSLHILIICHHPYVTEEIISVYSKKFDNVIVLPDITYEFNIIHGLVNYYKFMKHFKREIKPLIKNTDSFDIVSDCSAYFPVNALLSSLKNDAKCNTLISTREDYGSSKEIDLFLTIRTLFYTTLLGLYRVYSYKTLAYLYVKEPRDRIVMLLNPFEKNKIDKKLCADGVPIRFIRKRLPEKKLLKKDVIVFYSDRNLKDYGTDLTEEEHSKRLKIFIKKLSEHYENCRIVCKPHPLDKGTVIPEMQEISFELYNGSLTSQMHIDLNINSILACYSIASTSLIYAASVGIPSYTIYKYLKYNNQYPQDFFENDQVIQNKFLYHIRSLEEIGKIDNIYIEPIRSANVDNVEAWDMLTATGKTAD